MKPEFYLILAIIPYALILLPLHEYFNWNLRAFRNCYWIRVVQIIGCIAQVCFGLIYFGLKLNWL